MQNFKISGRYEANANKNNVNNPTVQDNLGQELTISEKLEMKHRVNQLILDKVVKSILKKVEKLLLKGKYEAAANQLKMAVEATGNVRVRLPYALMRFYGLGGKGFDLDMLLYHLRLAAADGHIPSMHLLAMLYSNAQVADVYHEGQIMANRARILDPKGKLGSYLNVVLSAKVMSPAEQAENIIKAIHEPTSHFYNHEAVGKSAALLDLSTIPNRRFAEITGGHHCEEMLDEAVRILHAGRYKDVEYVLKQAAQDDVAAANWYLALFYIGLGHKKEAFDCVDIAVAFGNVPLMYTLSAMYRCGYGVKKSNLMADAWYWQAVELDIDNRGLKAAITL